MALIVQKYGGTSVADDRARSFLVAKVKAARAAGDEVVLVVSAMGRRGAPYATDTLLELLRGVCPDVDPMTSDLVASCGEVISASLVSALLQSQGIPSVPMTAHSAGIRAEGPHGDASPTGANAAVIRAVLKSGSVPVITGFQGIGPGGELLTLGRGGSDTSGVAVGLALGADFVDIYTDVPGVAKADPRVVPDAPFMDFLDYGSMFRLAKHGARVLHDKSATLAMTGRVRLRVRSTFDDGEGTLIGPAEAGRKAPDFIGLAAIKETETRSKVTAIFAEGRKTVDAFERAVKAAAPFAPKAETVDDEDAVAFRCDTAVAGELVRALFKALN
jgi:aspartate kinase